MLSVPDIAIIGAVALLVFGPEQLPVIARKFGTVMRDVQNTSQQFIREMERAADEHEPPRHLEAVPSSFDETPAAAEPLAAEEHPAYEPQLPGIEPEPEPPKKSPEPAEF